MDSTSQNIVSFFYDPWVISIIMTIIIPLPISWYKYKKENQTRQKLITNANIEIVNSLKQYLVSNSMPTVEVIHSIVLATSRKYNVHIKDLNSISSIFGDLYKEINDNIFISVENKNEFMQYITCYLETTKKEDKEKIENENIENQFQLQEENQKLKIEKHVLSLCIGSLTFIGIILNVYILDSNEKNNLGINEYLLIIFILSTYEIYLFASAYGRIFKFVDFKKITVSLKSKNKLLL